MTGEIRPPAENELFLMPLLLEAVAQSGSSLNVVSIVTSKLKKREKERIKKKEKMIS